MLEKKWLSELDELFVRWFAMTTDDAGFDAVVLLRYADLSVREAALQLGEDYDIARIDTGWR